MPSRIVDVAELPDDMAALWAYWDGLRGDRVAPPWSAFDLFEVPARLLPTTMVVNIADPIENSSYRFWGSGLTLIHGRDMTGGCPYDLQPASLGRQVLQHHKEAVAQKTAIARTLYFQTARGLQHEQTLIRLPLSDDGEHVHHLVIVVDHSAETLEKLKAEGKVYADIYPDPLASEG